MVDKGSVSIVFFGMMAKFLNIHIDLIEFETNISNSFVLKVNQQIENPVCTIVIHYSNNRGHAEYLGRNEYEKRELSNFYEYRNT